MIRYDEDTSAVSEYQNHKKANHKDAIVDYFMHFICFAVFQYKI